METSVDEKFVAFHLRRSFLCCEYGSALLCCPAIIHTRLQQNRHSCSAIAVSDFVLKSQNIIWSTI